MEIFLESHTLPNLQKLSGILKRRLTFVDLETTGLVHEHNFSIIEIGVVTITPNEVVERNALVNPGIYIPGHITQITGITNDMVKGKKSFSEFSQYFHKVSQEHIFMGFNSKSFDSRGLVKMGQKHGLIYTFENQIDVRHLFLRERNKITGVKSQKGNLTEASSFYHAYLSGNAHRAGYDIALTALLAEKIIAKHGLACLKDDIEKLACSHSKLSYHHHLSSFL